MFTTFYTVYMLISFIFCCNINLKVISILECLLQTQIHGKKSTCIGKNIKRRTLCYIAIEIIEKSV